MASKNYLPGLAIIMHSACRYVTRYRVQLEAAIKAAPISDADKAKLQATLDTIVAACSILDALTGY